MDEMQLNQSIGFSRLPPGEPFGRNFPVCVSEGPFGGVVAVSANPITSELVVKQAYATLFAWALLAARAYSHNTCQAWSSDWKLFSRFCLQNGRQPLPAQPESVGEFIRWRTLVGNKPATISRAIATIATAHRGAGVANPCESEVVRLRKREMYRQLGARQDQARGLVWSEIERYLALPILMLRDYRDRALITVAYDTMCRSEELVEFDMSDISWMADGSGVILIRRAKNDQEGEGHVTFLSRLTVKLLRAWLEKSKITTGAIFRIIEGHRTLGPRLAPAALCERIRCVGQWIGLAEDDWKALSGHSCRVGATQDLFAANFQLPTVMQQGRWKDARMPARYGERILASRAAMAQLAQQQGR